MLDSTKTGFKLYFASKPVFSIPKNQVLYFDEGLSGSENSKDFITFMLNKRIDIYKIEISKNCNILTFYITNNDNPIKINLLNEVFKKRYKGVKYEYRFSYSYCYLNHNGVNNNKLISKTIKNILSSKLSKRSKLDSIVILCSEILTNYLNRSEFYVDLNINKIDIDRMPESYRHYIERVTSIYSEGIELTDYYNLRLEEIKKRYKDIKEIFDLYGD